MGNIIDMTADRFETEVIQSKRTVLVDFWAEWCGPCKLMSPYLDELAEAHTDTLDIVKVNVETEEVLKERFGIKNIPQLVIIKGGEETARFVGFMGTQTPAKLREFVQTNI